MAEHTRLPECPHCGFIDEDAWEIDFNSAEIALVDCPSCDFPYAITRYVDITYSTSPSGGD